MTDHRKPITESDVLYVAELANLELTDEERARMVKDLNSILDYVDRLNELDTSNVEPMAQTSDRYGVDVSKTGTARFAYATREDKTRPSLPRDTVMENAPEGDGAFFKVPRVIEK
jgi:aspartyl-tRNA(Asn)/glutamyl-tRNA(Gln) amidotransferase subunit C